LLAKLIIINPPQSTKKKIEKIQLQEQQERTKSSVQQTPIMECSKTSKTSKRPLCILHPTAKKKNPPKTKRGKRKKTYPKHQSTPFGLLLLLLLLLPTALDDTPTTKAQNMVAASAPHCF